jgi:hypothetical protein
MEWKAAMQQEYDSPMNNGTWEFFDLPADHAVECNMWIFKIKSDTENEVSRYKARFMAKGCNQGARFDYTYILSPRP